jgi:lysozyme family protein
MKDTYERAITKVFQDEGGYSNDAGDPGGPTNWGITIFDARMYWKADATAQDVRDMPRNVAEQIYINHYANPIHYDDLPAGVDYTVLDYGINSGISRAAKVLQGMVKVSVDGIIGPITLEAAGLADPTVLINSIWAERLSFLRALSTWRLFGKGWTSRCMSGRQLALQLAGGLK